MNIRGIRFLTAAAAVVSVDTVFRGLDWQPARRSRLS